MSSLQVIDITSLFEEDASKGQKISSEICKALESVGACFIKGHGISPSFLRDFRKSSRGFFQQSEKEKKQYIRHHQKGDYIGWTGTGVEKLNPEAPGDLREIFDYKPADLTDTWQKWAATLDGDFKTHCEQFFDDGSRVAQKILRAITNGLGLGENNDIVRSHSLVGKAENATEIRISYKASLKGQDTEPQQARVGEHTDFGTFSLYFQEGEEGFEIYSQVDQRFIFVEPVENACILLVSDMLQRFTADKFKATRHRALVQKDGQTREPMVDFVVYFLADNDALVTPVDGSDKYPPKIAIDLLHKRMEAMWSDP